VSDSEEEEEEEEEGDEPEDDEDEDEVPKHLPFPPATSPILGLTGGLGRRGRGFRFEHRVFKGGYRGRESPSGSCIRMIQLHLLSVGPPFPT
jgi:hypothetical protein